jgi:threonine dehydrogenase-like Zn-dependent dehydrogenase
MVLYRALFTSGRRDLELKTVEISDNKPLAKMLMSGICGTDKHVIKGEIKDVVLPRVLGHENVGEVDGVRYVWPAIIPCNNCENCKAGHPNLCVENQVFGLTAKDPTTGGWAEYTPLPRGTVLYKVPDSVSDEAAVLIETIASTKPIHYVGVEGKDVLIVGSGPIGLVASIHAKILGANSITMVGHKEQASLIGKTVDKFFEKNTPPEIIGEKFDIVYDAGGDSVSCAYCMQLVKPFGVILESACMSHSFIVDLNLLIRREARLFTQYGYVPSDFVWATKLLEENQRDFSRVISHIFRLDEHQKVLDLVLNKRHGKVIFKCNE